MSPDTYTLTARWVFPVRGSPLPGGCVVVRNGVIAAVRPRGSMTADEDLGNVALIPGLVNPHTHLDLSGARGRLPVTDPDHFPDWLARVVAFRRSRTPDPRQHDSTPAKSDQENRTAPRPRNPTPTRLNQPAGRQPDRRAADPEPDPIRSTGSDPDPIRGDIRAGLGECLRFGTTLLGDIAADGASWSELRDAPLRAVVFYELIGLSDERAAAAADRFRDWLREHPNTPTCRAGVSPHAPYSVARSLLAEALATPLTCTIHLAEAPGERQLLACHTGPFREFLERLGVWHPQNLIESAEAVVRRSRDRTQPVLFAHGNDLAPGTVLGPRQSVVYCPRTHAAFGHAPHPFREFLRRGGRVCLGTDSLASNPDLDVLAEARFLRARYPDFPGERLLELVTLAGAEALGWERECGSLEAGKSADLVAVPLPDRDAADPHELLFADHPGPRRTMFRGRWRD